MSAQARNAGSPPHVAALRAAHAGYRSRLALGVLPERCLGGGKPRDRHAEGRARDVIESDLVAEGDRGGGGGVLAAKAEFDVGARFAPALDRDAHQFAHTVAVEGNERIDFEDALARIGAEEARGVVARDAKRRLGEIVGAEREELSAL